MVLPSNSNTDKTQGQLIKLYVSARLDYNAEQDNTQQKKTIELPICKIWKVDDQLGDEFFAKKLDKIEPGSEQEPVWLDCYEITYEFWRTQKLKFMVLDDAQDTDANQLGEIFVKLGEIVRAQAEGKQIDSILTVNSDQQRQHEIMIKAEPVYKAENTITIKVQWKNIKNKKRKMLVSSKIEACILKVSKKTQEGDWKIVQIAKQAGL